AAARRSLGIELWWLKSITLAVGIAVSCVAALLVGPAFFDQLLVAFLFCLADLLVAQISEQADERSQHDDREAKRIAGEPLDCRLGALAALFREGHRRGATCGPAWRTMLTGRQRVSPLIGAVVTASGIPSPKKNRSARIAPGPTVMR